MIIEITGPISGMTISGILKSFFFYLINPQVQIIAPSLSGLLDAEEVTSS